MPIVRKGLDYKKNIKAYGIQTFKYMLKSLQGEDAPHKFAWTLGSAYLYLWVSDSGCNILSLSRLS